MYIDNVYIGYWIIENAEKHAFDNMDLSIIDVVKENIVSVLKTVVHQKTLETIVRKDLFTGLYSEEYLYGEGRKIIDQYTTSTICMFKITNLEEINKNNSRELGNIVVTEVSKYINENISDNYIFVRYMGPKFAIVFSGAQEEGVQQFMTTVKETLEKMEIPTAEDYTGEPTTVSPTINVVMANYYKGTAIDGVTKELEKFLDNSDQNVITVL